jgi:hypothetical protein
VPNTPRALVLTPVLDGQGLAATLDKILTGFESAVLTAQLINTAYVERESKTWLLFPFLDKGTKPHYIGEGDEVLANRAKDFGPVWGPVFHPGTRPYDITSRVAAYMEAILDQRVSFPILHFAGISSKSDTVPWVRLRKVLIGVLNDATRFARDITPDSWVAVKASYDLKIEGQPGE